jgi:heterodisulfide reductase subunit A
VEKVHTVNVGAVVLAAGTRPFNPAIYKRYGYGLFPNVISSMEFERILSASGPFQGHLMRPSDGHPPTKIAWVQCVGSRDTSSESHVYCSGVCCMYAVKEAVIAKEHAGKDLDAVIFFMDMRTHGKDFDRYYDRAKKELGVRFIRSRIHSVETAGPGSDDLRLTYADEDGGLRNDVFDLLVLSTGLEVSKETRELAHKIGIELDPQGFVKKGCLTPVESSRPGVYVCGSLAGPGDIPQSVIQASAASSAASSLLAKSRNTLIREKTYPPEKSVAGEAPRIGVFVCHCGINIGSVVDVPAVQAYAAGLPHVVYAGHNLFTCSQDTQEIIREAINEHRLNRVVVAACTPRTHEALFRETIRDAGLNPYLLEFANIRDQDAWVHQTEPEEATLKAKDLVRMAVSKAALSEPAERIRLDMNQSALVIGGGIAGMNAALKLAEQGFITYLVERAKRLGGYGLNLKSTWTGEDLRIYVGDLTRRVHANPNIEILLDANIREAAGFVGNFTTTVEVGGEVRQLVHGVTILATGGDYLRPDEYMYGRSERVTCWHELTELFEKEPWRLEQAEAVAFIQCVGSREAGRFYCSKVCCTASIQQAIELKRQKPDLEVYILYRDMRTYGQREELYRKAREMGVVFIRYSLEEKPSVKQDAGRLRIEVKDHVLGFPVELPVDYVNLFTAIVPKGQETLSQLYKVPLNEDGFFLEAHMKLRPVEFSSDGLFVCGVAHYPKPVEESIAQAQAAASRALALLVRKEVEVEPLVSVVDQEKCMGCGFCEASCPFGAIRLASVPGRGFRAENIPALCKGCGICAAGCPQRAIDMIHFRDTQIFASIEAGCESARPFKDLLRRASRQQNSVSGYLVADGYYYHLGHSWTRLEKGGRLRIGIDDFAGKILGPASNLELPPRGSTLRQDQQGWAMIRDGRRAPFLSPATGKVFAVNKKVLEDPEIMMRDPYREGWLFVLEPLVSKLEMKKLFLGESSLRWLNEEVKMLLELMGPDYERLAATGGEPITDLFGNFPVIGWERLVKTFLRTEVSTGMGGEK